MQTGAETVRVCVSRFVVRISAKASTRGTIRDVFGLFELITAGWSQCWSPLQFAVSPPALPLMQIRCC